ncbi:unnamed protein product [Symbiodinium necroappetens]|uniref:Uncharacterized protein n=1 Tax=Symbiodinium necroappetens TaxID=1628268 RepID=A0A812MFA1_9DINO|nr:unnamed protein product [Symbiodinium necroappetens]
MGCCASKAAESLSRAGHERYAPMWVVKVTDVLKMQGPLRPHQTLMDEGLLVCWDDAKARNHFVIFVSHQWLGLRHPDPNGVQLKVLQDALKNVITGQIKVQTDFISDLAGAQRTLRADERKQIEDGYIWFDYFSVPQCMDASIAPVRPHSVEAQTYIKSIPDYVDTCQMFVALVPKATTVHSMKTCDYRSWLQRGWCRTELWCKLLSSNSKIPVAVVTDAEVAKFMLPRWMRYPAHSGDFTVEADRSTCCEVVDKALRMKLLALQAEKNMARFRFFTGLYEHMVGLPPFQRRLDEFMADFALHTVRDKGLGPVACAVLAQDREMLRSLVERRASPHTSSPALPDVGIPEGCTPIHFAARSTCLESLETLLQMRADPHSSSTFLPTPLGFCRTPAAVEVLVRYQADVNFPGGKYALQYFPLQVAIGEQAPLPVIAKLLELRANVNGGEAGTGGAGNVSPLGLLSFGFEENPDLIETAQLLLDKRANVNQVAQLQGLPRIMELTSRAVASYRRNSSEFVKCTSAWGSSPLGYCVVMECEELLAFLCTHEPIPGFRKVEAAVLLISLLRQEERCRGF